MKKSLAMILSAVFLLLFFTSCGLTVTTIDNSTESTTESTTVTTTTTADETTTEQTETSTSAKTQEEASTTQITASTTANAEETTKKQSSCTIEISCKTILSNLDELEPAKKDYVPANGDILIKTIVPVNNGDTVFDILKKVCEQNNIHIEYRFTPAYNSYYIEGIHQFYEFDCGDNSGWMYSLNNVFPNKGCNMYYVNDGDNIKFLYTCDLGSDLGAGL